MKNRIPRSQLGLAVLDVYREMYQYIRTCKHPRRSLQYRGKRQRAFFRWQDRWRTSFMAREPVEFRIAGIPRMKVEIRS